MTKSFKPIFTITNRIATDDVVKAQYKNFAELHGRQ